MNGKEDFAIVNTNKVLNGQKPKEEGHDHGIPPSGAMQVRTQYSTAVHVIKPRNLQEVLRKCLEEAAIAGEDFYYSWKQGGEIIEGLTVGCATALVRNFGNCAVDCRVEELGGAYLYYAAFIDLETGFNLVRPFRQNKQSPKKKDGSDIYRGERGTDIIFQIGVSKATRNVALNAVPKWLSEKVFQKAKENVTAKIAEMGIEKARKMVSKKSEAIGILLPRIEMVYGKQASWDIESIVQISSALRAIEDGIESVDSLFPIRSSPRTEETERKGEETKQEPIQEAQPAPITSELAIGIKETDLLFKLIENAKSMASLKAIEKKREEMFSQGEITEVQNQTVVDKLEAVLNQFKPK